MGGKVRSESEMQSCFSERAGFIIVRPSRLCFVLLLPVSGSKGGASGMIIQAFVPVRDREPVVFKGKVDG